MRLRVQPTHGYHPFPRYESRVCMYIEDLIFAIITVVLFVIIVRALLQMLKKSTSGESTGSNTAGAVGATKTTSEKAEIIEDIKSTPTSRVVDAISIVDELSQTSQNFRQYCELVGTTQATSSVTAPYSKREVAYYDVRCFRIDRVNGRNVETLVAHETSVEPFYFTDTSCDTKVYVNLAPFGDNCILVNSANRVEGPTSDFSKAVMANSSTSRSSSARYAVANALSKGANVLEGMRWRVSEGARALTTTFTLPAMAPAYAGGYVEPSCQPGKRVERRNVLLSKDGRPRPGGPYGYGGNRPSNGGRRSSSGVHFYGGQIPSGLDSFLDLGGAGQRGLHDKRGVGGPQGGYYYGSKDFDDFDDIGKTVLNIGLGMLLSSMATSTSSAPAQTRPVTTTQSNSFLGYRIVEDIVPCNYPVYCLGELYRHGGNAYMGKCISTDNSYYFATKIEAELVAHLQG